MRVVPWYHVWADGAWSEPLAEFEAALGSAWQAPEPPPRLVTYFGITGSEVNRRKVLDIASPWVEADAGSESVTLNALRAYAQGHGGAVIYAHTKGASDNTPFRARWRRSMTSRVVGRWRENLALLETGDVDAVGCHWLTEAEYPGMFGPMTIPAEGSGFFGGNFWMARCDYLRTLPPCPAEPRWEAERWIGLNSPRVVDLLPGWPHDNRWPELCG